MFGRKKNKAWVVAVDMGYGHQRAALPFADIAQGGKVITANDYSGIPESDKKIWEDSRRFYETISRFKKFPMLGDFVFALFDKFQEIKDFYPIQESIDSPSLQLKQVYRLFANKSWGKHFIAQLNKNPLPLLCTFFIPAQMAEFWRYKGPVYLVIPDTDISRAWAPLQPQKSNIVYCASTKRVAVRLKRYGIREENIEVTGFPLPAEFTRKSAAKARKDLRRRLEVLDPARKYLGQYQKLVEQYVGSIQSQTFSRSKSGFRKSGFHRVVLTFAIGGAGAQVELAEDIMEGAKSLLRNGSLEFHIIAGIHRGLASDLKKKAGRGVFVHSSPNKKKYFQDFSKILSKTDLLWTKPSELVFYAGLGIPLIMAPPIGSQEKFNRTWLLDIGAGIDQKNPEFLYQWLPDLLETGRLAECAMQGFIEISKDGVQRITNLIFER